MRHWIVLWDKGELGWDAPELDVLDLDDTGGAPIESHPGYVTAPKRLPLKCTPRAPIFRGTGYPWAVLATDAGRAQLEAGAGGRFTFRPPTGLRPGSIPLRFSDPWALDARVRGHNWDDGDRLLWEVVRSPSCDRSTALRIFWYSGAAFLQQWAVYDDVPPIQREFWHLVQHIEQQVLRGAFIEGWVWYDPDGEELAYAKFAHKFVRTIPSEMLRPTGPRPNRDLPPLHEAIERCDLVEVLRLLDAGADPTERSDHGAPLGFALKCRDADVLDALLAHTPALAGESEHAVCLIRDLALLKVLCRHAEPAEMLCTCGDYGWVEGIAYLLAQGCDIETRAGYDQTSALHRAATEGHVAAVAALLAAGASPDTRSKRGTSALSSAAQGHETEVCRLLLEAGASDPDAGIYWACLTSTERDESNPDLLELLLRHGADADESLRSACRAGKLACVELALRHGAAVDAADSYGNSALHHLVELGPYRRPALDERAAILERLLEHGADPAVRDAQGRTPLQLAEESGHTAAAARLRRR